MTQISLASYPELMEESDTELPPSAIGLLYSFKRGFVVFDLFGLVLGIICTSFILYRVITLRFLLVGYRRLLISLLAADLMACKIHLIAFIVQYKTNVISIENESNTSTFIALQPCLSSLLRSLTLFSVFAILLNLCGMSIDHYIGVYHPLQYVMWMKSELAKMLMGSVWIIALILGFSDITIASIVDAIKESPLINSHNNDIITSTPREFVTSSYNVPPPIKFTSGIVNIVNMNERRVVPSERDEQWSDLYDKIRTANSSQDILTIFEENLETIQNSADNANVGKTINVFIGMEKSTTPTWSQSDQERLTAMWSTCSRLNDNKIYGEFTAVIFTVICFFFLTFFYGAILGQVSRTAIASKRKMKVRKLVLTTIFLLGAFALCWLPMMAFEMFAFLAVQLKFNFSSPNFLYFHWFFDSLFHFHSLIDCCLFVFRVPALKRYVVEFLCCSYHGESNTRKGSLVSTNYSIRKTAIQSLQVFVNDACTNLALGKGLPGPKTTLISASRTTTRSTADYTESISSSIINNAPEADTLTPAAPIVYNDLMYVRRAEVV